MNDEARNARAAGLLIACMTCGAMVLFALEPASPRGGDTVLLMAEAGAAVEGVVIEYIAPDMQWNPVEFDGVVHPDGEFDWSPRGEMIRLALVGSSGDRLPMVQAERLLSVLGGMRYAGGWRVGRVALGDVADAKAYPAGQPSDLRALLVRKGIIR